MRSPNRLATGLRLRIALAAVFALVLSGVLLVSRTGNPSINSPVNLDLKAKRQLLYMGVALTRLNKDCGRYPTSAEGLDALIVNRGMTNWHGPYLETLLKDTWRDPWGSHYVYSFESNRVSLFTAGPDMKPHTDDDLVSPHFRLTEEDRLNDAIERSAHSATNRITAEAGTLP